MKTLKQLFPPWLLAMILYVQLVFLLVNYAIYDSRELIIFFSWIPLLLLPHFIFKKNIFYKLAVIIFFIGGLINLSHLLIVKGPISASNLFVLLNTNISEAGDFIHLKFTWRLLLLFPYLFLFVVALKKGPTTTVYPKRMLIVTLIFLISISFLSENIIHGRFIRKAVPQTTKALISFTSEMKTYKALKKRKIQEVDVRLNLKENGEQVVVLIIGESCNRNHMSLYGYSRTTNPLLEKRKDIIVYKDVVSAYSNTIPAVLSALTEANIDNGQPFDKSLSLIDLFHSAGFTTFWLSNQSPLGVWDNAIYDIAQTSDATIFVNNFGNSSMESAYISSYDEQLFQPFNKVLTGKTENKFIIIHLNGNHTAYNKRYPAEFNRFTGGVSRKEKLINEYDNSIFYNDFVVDSLLNTLNSYCLNHNTTIGSAIYLSDHSENVYDENNNVGHDFSGSLPKANVEIPFIVWLSPTYKTIFPEKQLLISDHRERPFVSDDLFHAVIDMGNMECNAFNSQRSIFNPDFNVTRKRILEDKMDYDLK